MDNEEYLEGNAVVCPYKVKGVNSFCPLANIKFVKQQDFEMYYKEYHQIYFSRGEKSLFLHV